MDRAAFCCGNDELDDFFIHHAARHHAAHRVRVTVAIHGGRIVGFYWLVAHGQPLGRISRDAEAAFDMTKFDATPLVYLGMIGTDRSVQGLGIGKILMVDAMRQTLAVADVVGVYALTLDAIDAETARRYAKWGFEYCVEGADTSYIPMYIPVETIRKVPGI